MADSQVLGEFSKFGQRMYIIAILSLISFILGIVGIFVPIVQIISYIIEIIIMFYFLLIMFGNIKRFGRALNNHDLLAFTPRFLIGSIIRFIGLAVFSIGSFFVTGWVSFVIMVIIGVGFVIFGSILRYMAWHGFEIFFKANFQLFPPNLSNDGRSGAKYCKFAAILDATIILAFLGSILRIVGYFKLGSLKKLVMGPAPPTYQPPPPQPTPILTPSTPSFNYCPNCGSPLSSGARFCPECGSEIS